MRKIREKYKCYMIWQWVMDMVHPERAEQSGEDWKHSGRMLTTEPEDY